MHWRARTQLRALALAVGPLSMAFAACSGVDQNDAPLPDSTDAGDVLLPQPDHVDADSAPAADAPQDTDGLADGHSDTDAAYEADTPLPCQMTVPTPLVSGLDEPQAIAVDATFVYWTNRSGGSQADGSLMKIAKTGGASVLLADALDQPFSVFPYDSWVYWINIGFKASDGLFTRIPKTGGTPTALLDEPTNDVAIDTSGIYVTVQTEMRRYPHGWGSPVTLLTEPDGLGGLALDATSIYYLTLGTGTNYDDARLMKVAKTGGTPITLATGIVVGDRPFVYGGHVYWASQGSGDDGEVSRVAVDGGPVEVLASGLANAHHVVVDEVHAYWANLGTYLGKYLDGSVARVPRAGGAVEILADIQAGPEDVAIDDQAVYWVLRGTFGAKDGSVMRLCK